MTPATHHRRILYGKRRRAAFVRAGLRSDGVPRAKRKPCGCLAGSCLKCAMTTNARITKPALVASMFADYQTGMSLEAVGRKYPQANGKPRVHGCIRDLFVRRGLVVRPFRVPKLGFGVRIPEPAAKVVRALIAGLKHLAVPRPLKQVWKRWSFAKRRGFIKKLRVKFPSTRPTGPFSKNVEPFEYGAPRVHEIAAVMNVGRNSQTKVIALKPGSEGVIWNGQIFFWAHDCYVRGCGWRPGEGRPVLSRVIWEKRHRKPVPDQFTVIQLDGNKNNFNPRNLGLRSMADCARMNAWHRRPERYPGLMTRAAAKAWITRDRNRTLKDRAQTAALLDRFQTPNNSTRGLLASLEWRKNCGLFLNVRRSSTALPKTKP